MAKPNYQFEKRQRELAKKAKKAEKAARKANGESGTDDEPADQALIDSAPGGTEADPAASESSSDGIPASSKT